MLVSRFLPDPCQAMLNLTTSPDWARVFTGLQVLISGGTTGIGRATALLLARNGARVFIFGRHERELLDALNDAQGVPGKVEGTIADQSRREDVEQVFRWLDERTDRLDVMINNAAIGGDDVMDGTDADINYLVQTNICGYIYCTRHAIRRMKPRKAGHIINIGSISAEKRKAGGEVYTATKSANRAFSESLRKGVQECGIKVTLVEPGLVGTDLIEVPPAEQREQEQHLEMMRAEDIAEVVCYCLVQSPRAVVTMLQIEPFRRQ
jgi:NADP-dependent 3-hydroxy acid dehydrogenase YdfG